MRGSEQPGQALPQGSVTEITSNGWPEYAEPGEPTPELARLARLSDLVRGKLAEQWAQRSGLVDSICHYALMPTGKLFRPVLLLESTAAVGGDLLASLPAAAGAECGHVASLIHDDIIDDDDLRRGRPSVQRKYGIADAIVAGDALIFQLFASLAECRESGVADNNVVSALDAVARAGLDLCRGQAQESELCHDPDVGVETYINVARLKTGALFRGSCECGAILGGGRPQWVRQLATYGEHLGIAFQIRDDLLPYVSSTQTTGKRTTSDVRNGRRTLPVILAYACAGQQDRAGISEALSGSADPVQALAFLRDVLARTGAVDSAVEMAGNYAEISRQALEELPLTPSRDRLTYIAELVIKRDR
jgi:geranylgeranyl pyrophosphate synthase